MSHICVLGSVLADINRRTDGGGVLAYM